MPPNALGFGIAEVRQERYQLIALPMDVADDVKHSSQLNLGATPRIGASVSIEEQRNHAFIDHFCMFSLIFQGFGRKLARYDLSVDDNLESYSSGHRNCGVYVGKADFHSGNDVSLLVLCLACY